LRQEIVLGIGGCEILAKKSKFVAIATAPGDFLGYFRRKKEVNRDAEMWNLRWRGSPTALHH
jgi:hypothetical protein